jgi:hypothetical protein
MSWSFVEHLARFICRVALLPLVVLVVWLAAVSTAHASSVYWVDVCGWHSGTQAARLSFRSSDLHNLRYANTTCADGGIKLSDAITGDGEPFDNQVDTWITAPAGEEFVGMAATYAFRYGADTGWQVGWQGSTNLGGFTTAHDPGRSSDCNTGSTTKACSKTGSGKLGYVPALRKVAIDIFCDRHPSCANDGTAYANVRGWSLLVKDSNTAAVLGLDPGADSSGDALVRDSTGAWISGAGDSADTLTLKATDPGGICYLGVFMSNSVGDVYDQKTAGSSTWNGSDGTSVLGHGGRSGQFTQVMCGGGATSTTETFTPDPTLNALATGCYSLWATAQNPAQYASGTYTSLLRGSKICVDNNTPSVSLGSNTTAGTWYGTPQQITVNASDGDGSGVAAVSCSGGGVNQTVTSFPATLTVSQTGSDQVSCTPTNNVGTVGTPASTTIDVDTQTPEVTFGDALPAPQWLSGTPEVTVASTESVPASGIQSTDCTATNTTTNEKFTTDSADAQAALSFNSSGIWKVSCTATSGAGITGTSTETVQIDNQQPTVAFSGASVAPAWSNGKQAVVASGSEAKPLSGIATTTCAVDGASQTYNGSSTSLSLTGQGAHQISCYATSGAGVQGPSSSETVQVDTSTPTITFSGGPSQTAWYAAAQSIVATAQDPGGGSGIDQIICSIAGVATPYPNTAGMPVESQRIVVEPQGGNLICSAENGADNWSSIQAWTFQIDTIPPTGDFLPVSPRNPTLAQVAIASHSGVASAQIRIGNKRLPTSWDPSTGIASATLPDNGSVPNGHYKLAAVVTDLAGNRSTITKTVAGKAAAVTLPIRILTALHVGSPGRRFRSCTTAVGARGTKLVTVCHTVHVPRALRMLKLGWHQSRKLSGLLETKSGEPLSHALIVVYRKPIGWPSRPIASVITNSSGRFSYRAHGPSGTITFAYAGTRTIHPVVARQQIASRANVLLNVPPHITVGNLRMSGQVQGGFIPAAGVLVQLWFTASGSAFGWQPFHNAIRTTKTGAWSVVVPVYQGSQQHLYSFRAQVDQQFGWPWLQTLSKVQSRFVD